MSKTVKKTHLLLFATGNIHKIKEVQHFLRDYPIEIKGVALKGKEIQGETVEEIAEFSVLQASKKIGKPIFTEDTGLFIKLLGGFPGPFSSYVYKTIGITGVLKLLESVKDRSAEFRSAIAFCAPDIDTVCFLGTSSGKILIKEQGIHGFGFDPIFEPDDGKNKTFAEMEIEEKNRIAHRTRSMRKFVTWYLKHYN
ncbi:non-canonical purine NTP pyrophosphatase, RdgB/HAM1 family [Candidatus Bathyarchaeota archaeon]|nr:MAG: non-canonical purine NTP pyrophosphatase, RdgB/HAM1 family [Candidatus Bathyarchaeota archaeon]